MLGEDTYLFSVIKDSNTAENQISNGLWKFRRCSFIVDGRWSLLTINLNFQKQVQQIMLSRKPQEKSHPQFYFRMTPKLSKAS